MCTPKDELLVICSCAATWMTVLDIHTKCIEDVAGNQTKGILGHVWRWWEGIHLPKGVKWKESWAITHQDQQIDVNTDGNCYSHTNLISAKVAKPRQKSYLVVVWENRSPSSSSKLKNNYYFWTSFKLFLSALFRHVGLLLTLTEPMPHPVWPLK